ncbi:MAG: type II toxin-antitoxin system RelE/ParE family toxin [Alphaproteobacteria bacterium]|jgi:phage-related protein|nr:type II toxin-antitoxin system RelE/ParE family toxin [Alphaproteobacteria bacterium]MBT4085158.1 type II toxin-antitoxin system RelE/ParE family toxin [Alphaproteobacteria bacterium]MBT4543226.1 type II toxin-antitoxin system RelE/ParE family toxin [Alphaproteobacteria bacterium]MBT6242646.1 type II toxin-antitoxin system RelE/ParE family toxin [Rhodospirillaceae bacterium]MBT6824569.1 type II toxin-antitoxin system RelE/ParE family toxin [Rhodospirillales bacterium]
MTDQLKRIQAVFYRSETGAEPVRDWLKRLNKEDRLRIGTDIKTVEFGWPIGMPTCKPMKHGLFEVRTNLGNRIARVLFCIANGQMVLLNGFIKKTQKTPQSELDLALDRKRKLEKSS